jgi:phosphopentomutase
VEEEEAMAPAGKRFDRVVLIVLDSVGIGDAPDAAAFGDVGADTLGHIHQRIGLKVPTLARLGLRRLLPLGPGPVDGSWGRLTERSAGKDTTTGHWEIAGARLTQAFPTYPDGFPPEVIEPFERAAGRKVLWNKVASGTEIIDLVGPEHMKTGRPIVYTSADSVFQIAAHIPTVPLETLYAWCRAAREILRGRHEVGRVIARPFRGSPGAFERDQGARRDFSVLPPDGCLPQALAESGLEVLGIGKIEDIYAGRGITSAVHTKDNFEGADETRKAVERKIGGLIFTNLVDFDSKYGHRQDVPGYARCLEETDAKIGPIVDALGPRDGLFITADHGNDPSDRSTDHTRERTPLLFYSKAGPSRDLGTRETFADLGQTIAANWGLRVPTGVSFLDALS